MLTLNYCSYYAQNWKMWVWLCATTHSLPLTSHRMPLQKVLGLSLTGKAGRSWL